MAKCYIRGYKMGNAIQTFMAGMQIDGTQADMLAEFTGKDGEKHKLIEAEKNKPLDGQLELKRVSHTGGKK